MTETSQFKSHLGLSFTTEQTETKHTPGPWRTGDGFRTVFGPPNGNPSPITIAHLPRSNSANARLIAAAPALLEACKLARAYIFAAGLAREGSKGPVTSDMVKLDAVIAQAEGT